MTVEYSIIKVWNNKASKELKLPTFSFLLGASYSTRMDDREIDTTHTYDRDYFIYEDPRRSM